MKIMELHSQHNDEQLMNIKGPRDATMKVIHKMRSRFLLSIKEITHKK